MVHRLQDGYHELLDSTPQEGPEVEVLEENENTVLVRLVTDIPEAGLEEGDESWVPQSDISEE